MSGNTTPFHATAYLRASLIEEGLTLLPLQDRFPPTSSGLPQAQKLRDLTKMVDSPEPLRLPVLVRTHHPRQTECALGKCPVRILHQHSLAHSRGI